MNNKELFKQAILDAKSVREAALTNAKKALEETLTPRLQSILSTKLREQEEDVNENQDEDVKENFTPGLEEELDLDEILAELELEEGTSDEDLNENYDQDLEEAEDDETETDPTEEPAETDVDDTDDTMGDMDDMGDTNDDMEGPNDEDNIDALTVGDFKNIVRDIIAQEMGGNGEMGGDELGDDDLNMDDAHDLSGGDGADMGSEDDFNAPDPAMGHHDDEDVNLEEILAELETMNNKNESKAKVESKAKAELKEAVKTIQKLRKELNEINLLNAKLLFVNKIFKSKNLTESQKAKVITNLDKANSVKEAKLIYETLSSSIKANVINKKPITESRGFASKAAGITSKQTTNIVNDDIQRWQFLAGIKKTKY